MSSTRRPDPKAAGRATAPAAAAAAPPSLLDAFPLWELAAADRDALAGAGLPTTGSAPIEKYEDPAGLALPPATQPFLDGWKRPEELVLGAPNVPVVLLRPAAEGGSAAAAGGGASPASAAPEKRGGGSAKASAAAASAPPVREFDGRLYAGHETFEWLLAVVGAVTAAERHLRRGDYLWELIASGQRDRDGAPARSPSGRYRVKLWLVDGWRSVAVDDRIPVDLFGRPLLVAARPLQLWPMLLCKAVLKVMATYRVLHMGLPSQVAAFRMLTGWAQEDLVDVLSGTPVEGGFLFDRLEDAVGWSGLLPGMPPAAPPRPASAAPAAAAARGAAAAAALQQQQPAGVDGAEGAGPSPAIVTCTLARRSKPERNPPRIVVLCGPGAVGRGRLARRLVAEHPDRFGLTVSTTTRLPREHEADGRDFHFTDKRTLLAGVRAGAFLEAARVEAPGSSATAPQRHWYGTSLATVREVAATGRLCVARLDLQGARTLRADPRIDGLYVYVTTSSPGVLEQQQRARLKEAETTLAKRAAWARAQCARAAAGGQTFDHVVANGEDGEEVYRAVKEAISCLSPVIRNRLRGLPAYVLDYSDLIAPNSVEQAFLKPVVVVGPHTGERPALLARLAEEFPDVFAFPRAHTTHDPEAERAAHVASDGDELALAEGSPSLRLRAPRSSRGAPPASGGSGGGGGGDGGGAAAPEAAAGNAAPPPVIVEPAAFDSFAAGGRFMEWHADLFRHPLATHRTGHTLEDVRAVIKAGKLPLLELEAEGVEALKAHGVDCLTIFLAPPSGEAYERRLRAWMTESDAEIAARQASAAAELELARSCGVFDAFVVNDAGDDGYAGLKREISRFRPDILPPPAPLPSEGRDEAAAAAGGAPEAARRSPVLLLCGPAGGGKEALASQLLARLPGVFALPPRVTDRRPGTATGGGAAASKAPAPAGPAGSGGGVGASLAGAAAPEPAAEVVKPEALARMAAAGALALQWQDAGGAQFAVTVDALRALSAAGKVAIVDVEAVEAVAPMRQQLATAGGTPPAAAVSVAVFAAFVLRRAAPQQPAAPPQAPAAGAMPADSAAADAAVAAAKAAEPGTFQAFVDADDADGAAAQLQAALSRATPLVPPLMEPLVVVGPFGSGKRAVLQRLARELLPGLIAAAPVVTTRERAAGAKDDMAFVSPEEAARMEAAGELLAAERVAGHVYGFDARSVRQLAAAGRLVLLDLDSSAQAQRLQDAGFKANFLLLQPPSLEALQQRLRAGVAANPPLGYEPEAAADAVCAAAAKEFDSAEAAAAAGFFTAAVPLEFEDTAATLARLAEALHRLYPAAVPPALVWGYGRPLWDPACRVYGRRPLRIALLGPAGSGKTTQCELLAARFGVPVVNAGDLLHAEVARKTPLGVEAQRHMHGSKTVPDRLFLQLLVQRLSEPGCVTAGWLLDGFPHTKAQARRLAAAGFVPDKVLFFEGPHALLSERIKHRRIDYATGRTYHLPPDGGPAGAAAGPAAGAATAAAAAASAAAAAAASAYSEPVRPLRPDGSIDREAVARLGVRHDDLPENVARRLALWDLQVKGLREAYEDVSLRVPARGGVAQTAAAIASFLTLEARLAAARAEPAVVPSASLQELTYRVVAAVRHQHRQLLRLQGLEGGSAWCDAKDLAANSACLLLHHAPAATPQARLLRRGDAGRVPQEHFISVSSREPITLLCSLEMAPQHQVPCVPAAPSPPRRIVVLCGPAGAGRSSIARQLLLDFPERFAPAPRLTARAAHSSDSSAPHEAAPAAASEAAAAESTACTGGAGPVCADGLPPPRALAAQQPQASPSRGGSKAGGEAAVSAIGADAPGTEFLRFVSEQDLQSIEQAGGLAESEAHLAAAGGTPVWALESAWAQRKAALVVAPLAAAVALKQLPGIEVTALFVSAPAEALERRLRLAGALDEAALEAHLADAAEQQQRAQQLAEEDKRCAAAYDEERKQSSAATAAPAGTPAPVGGATVPPMAALRQTAALAGQATAAPTGRAAAASAGFQKGAASPAAAAAQRAAAAPVPEPSVEPVAQIDAVLDNDGHLDSCYCRAKHALSGRWPPCEAHSPGLLLLQRQGPPHTTAQQAQAQPQEQQDCGAVIETPPDSTTLLRLRAVTAAASALQLPRGRHVLHVVCSDMLLHALGIASATDFEISEDPPARLQQQAAAAPATVAAAAPPLQGATAGAGQQQQAQAAQAQQQQQPQQPQPQAGVLRRAGEYAALCAGGLHLIFRYVLQVSEPCTAALRLSCGSTAAAAAARLLVVDNASGAQTTGPLNRIEGLQLNPGADCTVVAFVLPPVDLSAGNWSLAVSYSKAAGPVTATPRPVSAAPAPAPSPAPPATASRAAAAPPLSVQEVATSRVVSFDGAYAPNTRGVLARYVLAPTAPISTTLAARITPPVAAVRLRLLDLRAAREVGWVTNPYPAVAEAEGGMNSDGGGDGGGDGSTRLLVPAVQLGPGRYLALLELDGRGGIREGPSAQPVAAPPGLAWQLQIMPGADEKACPVVKDDAWERHLRGQVEAWQQQAPGAAVAAATALASAGTAPAKAALPPGQGGGGAGAGGKDRSKAALAVLERHQAESRPASAAAPAAGAGAQAAAAAQHAGAAAGSAAGSKRRASAGASSTGGAGVDSASGSTPRAGTRQLKGPGGAVTVVPLAAAAAVLRIPAVPPPPSGDGIWRGPPRVEPGDVQQQCGAGSEARRSEASALQAHQALEFADWRSQQQAAQQGAALAVLALVAQQQSEHAQPAPAAAAAATQQQQQQQHAKGAAAGAGPRGVGAATGGHRHASIKASS